MTRKGVALLVAVIVLGLVSATVATAVELARMEHRNGAGLLSAAQARGAAEAGVAEARQGWPSALRPVVSASVQPIWIQRLPQGLRAELLLEGTDGPFLILIGKGARLSAGGQVLAESQVREIVLADTVPGDSLDRPRRLPRSWWRSPP